MPQGYCEIPMKQGVGSKSLWDGQERGEGARGQDKQTSRSESVQPGQDGLGG